MRRNQVIAAAFFGLFGLAFASGAFYLGIGGSLQPGPGFFPLVIGSLLVLCSVLILFQEVKSRSLTRPRGYTESAGGLGTKRHSFDVIITSVCLLLFIVAIEPLGFLTAMFCLVLFLIAGIGRRPWKVALIYALVAVLFVHIVFERLLMLRLPLGIMKGIFR